VSEKGAPGALRRFLFRPEKSLFAPKKIPVPQRSGIGIQATENTSEFRAEKPPKGAFS
jgi:hypothetical protein